MRTANAQSVSRMRAGLYCSLPYDRGCVVCLIIRIKYIRLYPSPLHSLTSSESRSKCPRQMHDAMTMTGRDANALSCSQKCRDWSELSSAVELAERTSGGPGEALKYPFLFLLFELDARERKVQIENWDGRKKDVQGEVSESGVQFLPRCHAPKKQRGFQFFSAHTRGKRGQPKSNPTQQPCCRF